MFMGEFHHNLDEKNRVIIPAKLRANLGERFIITQGLEGCLFVYPLKEWDKITKKLNGLPFTKKDARTFSRFFISGATECIFDKMGRVNIPYPLIKYANLKRELIIIGVNDRIELWSKERWEKYLDENSSTFETIAENLFLGDEDA